jgi:thioredoxin
MNQFNGGNITSNSVGRLRMPNKQSRGSTVMKAAAGVHEMSADEFEAMVIEESKNQPVIVDFWASWCGPCKLMGILFNQIAAEYEGKPVKFVKFDLDNNKELAKKYDFEGLPAIIMYKDGEKVPDYHMEGCPSDAKQQIIGYVEAALKM